jgi:hypothetical protein
LKHIYFCQEEVPEDTTFENELEGYAVVAESIEEAKKISGMDYAEDMLRDKDAEELPLDRKSVV